MRKKIVIVIQFLEEIKKRVSFVGHPLLFHKIYLRRALIPLVI